MRDATCLPSVIRVVKYEFGGPNSIKGEKL